MRRFFRCLVDGVLATVGLVLFTVVLWAFLTLGAVVIVGFSPIWAILIVRAAQKVSSLKDEAAKALNALEEVVTNLEVKKGK